MSEDLHHIRDAFDSHRKDALTAHEKHVMRENLKLFTTEHPALAPFSIRVFDALERLTDFQGAGVYRGVVAAVLVLVIGGSVGTSYAAQSALPGDLLYAIKTGVTERLESALAFSDTAKAQFTSELANRRLEEAEILAAQGKLTYEIASELAAQVDLNATDFDTRVASLSTHPEHATIAADVQSTLEASLTAHEQVLASLETVLPKQQSAIAPILGKVRERARKAQEVRSATDLAIATTTVPDLKAAATQKRKKAEQRLSKTKQLAESVKQNGDRVAKRLSDRVSDAERALSEGDINLHDGEYDKAYKTFQEAIRAAEESSVGVDAQLRVKKNLSSSISVEAHSESKKGEDDEEHASTTILVESKSATSISLTVATSSMPTTLIDDNSDKGSRTHLYIEW